MSDEIKEIISYLKNKTFIPDETKRKYKILHRDEVNKLLDYITNLQDQVNALVNVKDKLLEENERLKNELVKIPRAKLEYELELENYKSRVEKAIESLKIKQIRYVNESDYVIDDGDLQEEINILQGGKNE